MKILMFTLSLDQASKERIAQYGDFLDELHVISYSRVLRKTEKIGHTYFYSISSSFRLLFLLYAYNFGKKFAREKSFDLITCQDPFEIGIIGYLLAKKNKIPLELQIHGAISMKTFWKDDILNCFRCLISRMLLPRACGIRVMREQEKIYLIKNLKISPNKICVLPISVPVENVIEYKKPNVDSDFIFLTIARLEKVKNIQLILRAFKKLVLKIPCSRLVIGGDGSEKESLQKLSLKLQINDRVDFVGWVEKWSSASCFIISSNSETGPRTLIEALAHGLPVISTKVGIAKNYIRDGKNGFLIDINDEKALYEKMTWMRLNKKLVHKMSTYAKNCLQEYPNQAVYLQKIMLNWRKIARNKKS
ncbi:MAG: glycosyltransferase family 4 protein [Patescibacteria group bacterium]|nr:glycosyltransferase family 4 protein [Patescibacteria group bacterium]